MNWDLWLALAAAALVVLWLLATVWQVIGALWQGALDLLAGQVARKLRPDDRDGAPDD